MLKEQNAGQSKMEALEGHMLSIMMCVLKINPMVSTDNYFISTLGNIEDLIFSFARTLGNTTHGTEMHVRQCKSFH